MTLREKLIEAMAGWLREVGLVGVVADSQVEGGFSAMAETVLDAAVDALDDERVEACYRHDLDYSTVERLIAALRDTETGQ